MVCATPRRPPNRAYLLLEAQPAISSGYTPNLITITIIIIEYVKLWYPVIRGMDDHKINTKNTLTTGDKKKSM